MGDRARHYEIAGITLRVESDLPITDATFDKKFAVFQVEAPGPDTVVIRHHFGLPDPVPGLTGPQPPVEIYRKVPWAVYRTTDSWVYLGISPEADDPSLHRVAIFTLDHSSCDIYSSEMYERAWLCGGLTALTMFPSDQILVARLLADRAGCYLHSGGLSVDGQGLVFVGHSEAGKSTTVELVRRELGDRAEILCDDRNIVRRWPGGFRVHGTWSHGDVPDVSAASAPLRAILFLEQHERNEIVRLTERKEIWRRLAATLIKPLVSADWWNKEIDVLEQLATEVPCFRMCFDKSGAIVHELASLIR